MRIIALDLAAIDLDALRRFYLGLLGLRMVETTPRSGERLSLQAGATRLNFIPAPTGTHPRYHFAFNVPPTRFAAAVDWLRQRGGILSRPTGEDHFHSQSWNADMVYFSDPQGNILELIARHTLPENEGGSGAENAGSFAANEILSISEIGIPCASVVNAVGLLRARIAGLTVYSGEGSDEFTAVGSPTGLLIVVRQGRVWYPETGVPAACQPLGVVTQVDGGSMYRISAPPFPFDIQSVNLSQRGV